MNETKQLNHDYLTISEVKDYLNISQSKAYNSGKISAEQFEDFKENICFSCGTCSMYGTANTMGVFTEVVGLCPIGSTTMLYCSAAKVRQARDVGERIVELTRKGVTARSFLTKESIMNGIRHVSATGGWLKPKITQMI